MKRVAPQRAFCILGTFVAAAWLLSARGALAAELYIAPQEEPVGVGGRFEVGIVLDTEGETINAIETEVLFPSEILELIGVQTNDSIVNFWIEKEGGEGMVSLSGAIPGGFTSVVDPLGEGRTTHGTVAALVFNAKAAGIDTLAFEDTQVLLHDGRGTPVSVKTTPRSFQVLDIAVGVQDDAVIDTTPPESFTVSIDRTSLLGREGHYLFFATEDKGSGIDHYEIKVGDGPWLSGVSPYYLEGQESEAKVQVRAVDRAGNVRTETLDRSGMDFEEVEFGSLVRGVLFLVLLTGLLIGIKALARRKISP